MLKSRKGISLTTMVITIMILLVIMGTLVYSALDSVKIKKLNNLYNDLKVIDDAVGIYYLKNGNLPIDDSKSSITVAKDDEKSALSDLNIDFVLKNGVTKVASKDSFFNPNDYTAENKAVYKYLNLSLMDNLSLTHPEDEYIINTQSHTVYNLTGVKLDDKMYHALPLEYEDTNYNFVHPVNTIRLNSVPNITASRTIYFSRNIDSINIKDLLIFDTNTKDGLGEPKTVKFSIAPSINSDFYTIDEKTGVLKRKNNPDDYEGITVNVSVTNYDETKIISDFEIEILESEIDIVKSSEDLTTIDQINLIASKTQSTYKNLKNIAEYYVKEFGKVSTTTINTISSDLEIATAIVDKELKATFKGEKKAGKATIELEARRKRTSKR